ncbi:MAG: hypothetical protein SangKO_011810 [Sandaracinaceae bacterium]
MIRSRVLLACLVGEAPADVWLRAAAEEAPVSGPPKACRGCPLRPDGEWEPGAKAALAEMTADGREVLGRRWGCHEGPRPCAGMRRLIHAEENRERGDLAPDGGAR